MLKLEKAAFDKPITIRLRKRDLFFSRSMMMALGIACALHLSGALLFRIRQNSADKAWRFKGPILVAADIRHSAAAVSSTAAIPGNDPLSCAWPDVSTPAMPTMGRTAIAVPTMPVEKPDAISPDFGMLGGPTYKPGPSGISMIQWQPMAAVKLCGMVETLTLEDSGLSTMAVPRPVKGPTDRLVASFEVQVDATSGTIFWTNQTHTVDSTDANNFAAQVLSNIRFHPKPSQIGSVVTGTVEVEFIVGSDETLDDLVSKEHS